MGIHIVSACAILAIIPLYWLPVVPEPESVWMMIAAGIALAAQQRRWLTFSGIGLLFFAGAY